MNELVFFMQIIVVFLATFLALRYGKTALALLACLQTLLANLFVLKQVHLFGWEVTCSDAFAIGVVLNLNLLQEYFGKPAAQKAGKLCLYSMVFFALVSLLHLAYIPSPNDSMNSSYQRLLLPAPRLLFASLFTFFIVQKADLLVFSKLKTKCSSFLAKNLYSLLSSQLLDTILFTFLGLYGLVASCFDVLLLSYLVKVAIIFSLSPLTHLFQKWIPLPRPYRS